MIEGEVRVGGCPQLCTHQLAIVITEAVQGLATVEQAGAHVEVGGEVGDGDAGRKVGCRRGAPTPAVATPALQISARVERAGVEAPGTHL